MKNIFHSVINNLQSSIFDEFMEDGVNQLYFPRSGYLPCLNHLQGLKKMQNIDSCHSNWYCETYKLNCFVRAMFYTILL